MKDGEAEKLSHDAVKKKEKSKLKLELRVPGSGCDASFVPFTSLKFKLYGELKLMYIDKNGMFLEVMLGSLNVNFTAH